MGEEIQRGIVMMDEEIQREIGNYQHLPKVIILGSEESGKTTLSMSLLDKPILINNKGKRLILQEEGIYSGSIKKKPSIKVDNQHRFIVCDCNINEDNTSEIIYSHFFDYLLKLPNNKFIVFLVISFSELDTRCFQVERLLESVKKLFKNGQIYIK